MEFLVPGFGCSRCGYLESELVGGSSLSRSRSQKSCKLKWSQKKKVFKIGVNSVSYLDNSSQSTNSQFSGTQNIFSKKHILYPCIAVIISAQSYLPRLPFLLLTQELSAPSGKSMARVCGLHVKDHIQGGRDTHLPKRICLTCPFEAG